MEKLQRDFLESLITAPSPAGYEQPVRQVYHAYTESFADDVRSDVHGTVSYTHLTLPTNREV